jgi:hypothetical protein
MDIEIPRELLLPLWTESLPGKRPLFQLRYRPNSKGKETQKKIKMDSKVWTEAECSLSLRDMEQEEMDQPVSFSENISWTEPLLASSCILRPKVMRSWMPRFQVEDRRTSVELQSTHTVAHIPHIV